MGLLSGLDEMPVRTPECVKNSIVEKEWEKKVDDFLSVTSTTEANKSSIMDIISDSPASILKRRNSKLSEQSEEKDLSALNYQDNPSSMNSQKRRLSNEENIPDLTALNYQDNPSSMDSQKRRLSNENIPISLAEYDRRNKLKRQVKYAVDQRIQDDNRNKFPLNPTNGGSSSLPSLSDINVDSIDPENTPSAECGPPPKKLSGVYFKKSVQLPPKECELLNKVSSLLTDICQLTNKKNQSGLPLTVDTSFVSNSDSMMNSIPCSSISSDDVQPTSSQTSDNSTSSITNFIEKMTGLELKTSAPKSRRSSGHRFKPLCFDDNSYRLLLLNLPHLSPKVKQANEPIDWNQGFHGRHIIRGIGYFRHIPHEPLYLSRPIKSNNQYEVVPKDPRLYDSSNTVLYKYLAGGGESSSENALYINGNDTNSWSEATIDTSETTDSQICSGTINLDDSNVN